MYFLASEMRIRHELPLPWLGVVCPKHKPADGLAFGYNTVFCPKNLARPLEGPNLSLLHQPDPQNRDDISITSFQEMNLTPLPLPREPRSEGNIPAECRHRDSLC